MNESKTKMNYPLREKHLELARKRAALWARKRKRAGLCINCNRPAVTIVSKKGRLKRGLRCGYHRGVYIKRSQQWKKAHGKKKYEALKSLGLCVSSPRHGLSGPSSHYCERCRKQRNKGRKAARRTK